MKRLLAAGVILVAVLALSCTGIGLIQNIGGQVETAMQDILKNPDPTLNKAAQFSHFWEKKREQVAIFVNHETVDEIGRVAARMMAAERMDNAADLAQAANEILFIMRGIKGDETFSLFTVL